uniref:adenosine deaminase n=1 Tax=Ciona savignyi TaxID=51511 RepID=H2Z8U9_CIOSA
MLPEDTNRRYNFPKAELHCHLDGSFRLSTCIELAKERGIELPSYDESELRSIVGLEKRFPNLVEYLQNFKITTPIFAADKDALSRLTIEAIEDKHKQGVSYIEFRFCPFLFANCNVSDITEA